MTCASGPRVKAVLLCAALAFFADLATAAPDLNKRSTYPTKPTFSTEAPVNRAAGDERKYYIVAMGDSMTSGEGAPDRRANRNDGDAFWDDALCHRSTASYATKMVGALRQRLGDRAQIVYENFACSGATVAAGIAGPQSKSLGLTGKAVKRPQVAQVREWMRSQGISRLDAVIVSIGINDIRFAKAVRDCLMPQPNCTTGFVHDLPAYWGVLQTGYRNTLRLGLQNTLGARNVFVLEYPDPLRNSAGRFCDRYDDGGDISRGLYWLGERIPPVGRALRNIDQQETSLAHATILTPLNQNIHNHVRANDRDSSTTRWTFVDGVMSATRYHGYCAGDQRYFNHIRDSLVKQDDLNGLIHPNDSGHQAMSNVLLTTLIRAMDFGTGITMKRAPRTTGR